MDVVKGDRASGIVDCALYEDGRRRGGVVPLDVALETAREAGVRSRDVDGEGRGRFVWIGLHEPTSEQFEAVAEEFALHPLAVEDAVHAHQRPKLETYGDTVFVVLKTVRYVDPREVIEVGEVMLFLGADFVVSVRHGEGSALGQVRRDLEARPELLRSGPSAVLYAVVDRIVDDYVLAEEGVANDIEEIEEQVFSGDQDGHAESWAAILAWMTLVAGVYGMNFDHMPELDWRLGYPFALSVMALGAALLYRAFRRNDWL